MCGDQIAVTVVVTQMEPPAVGVEQVEGQDSVVVGVKLTYTFLDRDGNPVQAVVGEVVTDTQNQKVITSTEPTILDQG